MIELIKMLTSHDLPALLEALRERQPRAGWVEGSRLGPYARALIPDLVAVMLPVPGELRAEDVHLVVLGESWRIPQVGAVEEWADAICAMIGVACAECGASIDRKQVALEALRDATEPDPLEGVTDESVSRLAAALTPPDAAELKWRAVPKVGVSEAALLSHYRYAANVALVLKDVTGLPVSTTRALKLEVQGTHAQMLRAGEALASLSNIAEAMLQARTHEAA